MTKQRQVLPSPVNTTLAQVLPSEYVSPGDGHTALMLASDMGDLKRVKVLLTGQVDVNARNRHGVTALMLAAKANFLNLGRVHPPLSAYEAIGELLLKHGASVQETDRSGNTVLQFAALGGNVPLAKLLIAKGASISAIDASGQTMLHAAALSGHADMAQLFIGLGLNVNPVDNRGETPLWLAIYSPEVFTLLVNHGADVKARNVDGETLLMPICGDSREQGAALVATQIAHRDEAKLLIQKGLDVNAKSDLSLAARQFSRQLRNFGVDRSMAMSGETALMIAARSEDSMMVKLLLASGADVNLSDEAGQTALIHACRAAKQENALLLLDNQADPNSVDSRGKTPLIIATQADLVELVKALLSKGSDIKFRDNNGKTAADYVISGGLVAQAVDIKLVSSTSQDEVNTPSQ